MPLQIVSFLLILSAFVSADILYSPPSQVRFRASGISESRIMGSHDPAGSPNRASRLEVTSNGTDIICGKPGDAYTTGYAHFTNSAGEEDKHMFWWLFHARNNWKNAPTVLTFGGGPGGSGMLFPFSGAGPCVVNITEDGHGEAGPSPYSWTDHVNLLAIDQPVGVGYSYGERTSLRNSSAATAWDVDDFLQLFWAKYPLLAKNTFMINSGSYGGTFAPHVINTIRTRNLEVKANRIMKMPDSVILVNVWSDPLSHFRWWYQSNCNPSSDGNQFFNATTCAYLLPKIPQCLDAIQLSYEQPILEYKLRAFEDCLVPIVEAFEGVPERDPFDARVKCPLPKGCSMGLQPVGDVLDDAKIKKILGIPATRPFWIFGEDINKLFIYNGDMIQPAYLLLAPAINDGLRVLIYNGMADGLAPWRSSLSWMRLIKTQHQNSFLSASEIEIPGVGSMIQAKGNAFTLVKIKEAGHMVIRSQPELLRDMMRKWIANETLF